MPPRRKRRGYTAGFAFIRGIRGQLRLDPGFFVSMTARGRAAAAPVAPTRLNDGWLLARNHAGRPFASHRSSGRVFPAGEIVGRRDREPAHRPAMRLPRQTVVYLVEGGPQSGFGHHGFSCSTYPRDRTGWLMRQHAGRFGSRHIGQVQQVCGMPQGYSLSHGGRFSPTRSMGVEARRFSSLCGRVSAPCPAIPA